MWQADSYAVSADSTLATADGALRAPLELVAADRRLTALCGDAAPLMACRASARALVWLRPGADRAVRIESGARPATSLAVTDHVH